MKITWIYEPTLPFPPDHEQVEDYRRFVDETARRIGSQVILLREPLCAALPEGLLFFFSNRPIEIALEECAPDKRANLAIRLVIMGASRNKTLELAESISPAAIVDSMSVAEWLADLQGWARGPFGRKELAAHIGATCAGLRWLVSTHYCLFESKTHEGLPHLLVDYLRVYERYVLNAL